MRRALALILVFHCVTAHGAPDLRFNASTPLYTRDSHAYAVNELPLALNAIRNSNKPIVLFIHGRGDEPGKSLRAKKNVFGLGSAVPMLEEQYGLAVLMFNWDSKAASMKDRSRPLGNMAAAADGLHAVILELQAYYSKNPSMKPVVLLAHSMGTIVVQKYVEKYGWGGGKRVFTNVLFTSADADNLEHANWVERIDTVERVFITINPRDNMLNGSSDLRPSGSRALGLDPGKLLTAGSFYVEVYRTGAHEIFSKKSIKGRPSVCHFFRDVLTGEAPDFGPLSAKTVANNRYQLLPGKAKKDECFGTSTQ
jgi:pimeloyl-ACP methyl ester carboxylesterase